MIVKRTIALITISGLFSFVVGQSEKTGWFNLLIGTYTKTLKSEGIYVYRFDSKTGERYWFHDFDDGFYSSPILIGDNVYLIDMMGVMYIFKAEKEFSLVNKCELGEEVVTIPVFMHGRIYIRGLKNLYCIGE